MGGVIHVVSLNVLSTIIYTDVRMASLKHKVNYADSCLTWMVRTAKSSTLNDKYKFSTHPFKRLSLIYEKQYTQEVMHESF